MTILPGPDCTTMTEVRAGVDALDRELSQPPINPIMPPAPQEELDGMIGQLDAMLMGAGFFHLPDKMQSTRRTLRTLLTKPGWSSQEIRTLRGVLSSLAGKRPRG